MGKISKYPAATVINDADVSVMVQSGITKKVPMSLVKAYAGVTGGGSAGAAVVPIGLLQGLNVVKGSDDRSVLVGAGSVEVGGALFNSQSQLSVSIPLMATGYGPNVCLTGTPATGYDYPNRLTDGGSEIGVSLPAGSFMPGGYFQSHLAAPKVIQELRLMSAENQNARPQAFTLWASNAGTFSGEEILLLTVTSSPDWTSWAWKEWTFDNTVAFSYYRIKVGSTSGGQFPLLTEMELMEAVYEVPPSTPYFIYVDLPTDGTELSEENLSLSTNVPEYDQDKGGYYSLNDSYRRAIAFFITDADGVVPHAIFRMGEVTPKNNFNADGWPTMDDNLSAGYSVGSLWFGGGSLFVLVWANNAWATWEEIPRGEQIGDFLVMQVFS